MLPWIDTFKKIKEHKYGKYSVLGNHDYGEYVTWPTEIEKKKIFNRLKIIWSN
jgi:predicted MPP superfamily phosphohydrolase